MSDSSHIKIVFMGTPQFAVEPLKAILEAGYHVPVVITAPDKPAGRGQRMLQSPVKTYALANRLEVLQPEKLRSPDFVNRLERINPDIIVVVAFRMLPEVVWRIPRWGTFNLHASLLPQYRGAAPINWAIINGETRTGVTTFLIDNNIDTGNILLREEMEIKPNDTAGHLHDRMMSLGARLVVRTIELLTSGKSEAVAQESLNIRDEDLNPAPKLDREKCRVNWKIAAGEIHNFIRGLSPSPGAWSILGNGKGDTVTVKLLKSSLVAANANQTAPGTIHSDGKTFVHVQCGQGMVSIDEMQLPGRRSLPIHELLMGFRGIEEYGFE